MLFPSQLGRTIILLHHICFVTEFMLLTHYTLWYKIKINVPVSLDRFWMLLNTASTSWSERPVRSRLIRSNISLWSHCHSLLPLRLLTLFLHYNFFQAHISISIIGDLFLLTGRCTGSNTNMFLQSLCVCVCLGCCSLPQLKQASFISSIHMVEMHLIHCFSNPFLQTSHWELYKINVQISFFLKYTYHLLWLIVCFNIKMASNPGLNRRKKSSIFCVCPLWLSSTHSHVL